jgi:hypothetical protein
VLDRIPDLVFGGLPEVPGHVGHNEDVVGKVDLPLVQLVECGLLGGVMADALAVAVLRRGVRVEADREHDLAAHRQFVVRLLKLVVIAG